MRKFLFLLALAFSALAALSCSDDMPCVTCDNSSSVKHKLCDIEDYGQVQIGDQIWLLENFNCPVPNSKCYAEDVNGVSQDSIAKNCDKYGRLYDWTTAKNICPKGWHLPTKEEWSTLISNVENDSINKPACNNCAGEYLKSKQGWNNDGNGQDIYDFSAMPGGAYSEIFKFFGLGNLGNWWSADEYKDDKSEAQGISMSLLPEITPLHADKNSTLYSVRCLQNYPSSSSNASSSSSELN